MMKEICWVSKMEKVIGALEDHCESSVRAEVHKVEEVKRGVFLVKLVWFFDQEQAPVHEGMHPDDVDNVDHTVTYVVDMNKDVPDIYVYGCCDCACDLGDRNSFTHRQMCEECETVRANAGPYGVIV